ncbi:hypothetical protein [Leifsonia sp. Leaf264]|uniref:hypothetical protein n=1 Tax=Leifsonia sp. Leaf264 TaxID=1736314 RepID=UPI0006F61C04|nr:hypothetical protein [Leifsonia sp. Leaf264]KQP01166.1 hypothetical protein ASF30_00535 [Leifsonia sp. Leaf264]
MTLRIALAGIAVLGVGAAITTAVWTDDVFFGATATASSFDLQGRQAGAPTWGDQGLPGDDATIVLTSTELGNLSPSTTVTIPFELCNAGTADGTIETITDPVIGDPLGSTAGANMTATITGVAEGDGIPSDTTCANPVTGNLVVTTTVDFPPTAMGQTGDISFRVTGQSD